MDTTEYSVCSHDDQGKSLRSSQKLPILCISKPVEKHHLGVADKAPLAKASKCKMNIRGKLLLVPGSTVSEQCPAREST
jgi:hypothetical protein